MPLPFSTITLPDAAALRAAIPTVTAAIQCAADHPDRPWSTGKPWTCAQMAWHIADAESVMLDRVRRILSLEEPLLPGIPQDIWAAQLPPRPLASAVILFTACRTIVADLVEPLTPVSYTRRGHHPEFGVMALGDVLRHLHGHALHHAAQLVAT
jgi:hypothetical protein